MELWYSEFHTGNVKLSVRINRQLFSGESEFQRIDVFESEEFGRFVALDGEIVFSDKDEFIYDEMVTHVPMTVHPNVKNVLIIGGGDGGVARELIHYPQIESIDVVESDKMFVDVCAEMFPDIAQGLKDERVNIYYEDGLRFLRNKKARYDLIINDSTDPLGHTEGLFTKEFYGSCYKALRDDGIQRTGKQALCGDPSVFAAEYLPHRRSFGVQPRRSGADGSSAPGDDDANGQNRF